MTPKQVSPAMGDTPGPENGMAPANYANLQQQAEALGIHDLQDVQHVMGLLSVTVWCYWSLGQMWGSPRLEVLHALVSRGMDLRIDESVMSTLRGLLQRAQDWSSTAHHELSKAEPAEFDMGLLQKLKEEALSIPVRIPEDRRVTAVIEDGGGRYCLCRGASDGGFMIGCDFCEEWFHGKCVNVATAKGEQMVASGASFECPTCASKRGVPYAFPDALPGRCVSTTRKSMLFYFSLFVVSTNLPRLLCRLPPVVRRTPTRRVHHAPRPTPHAPRPTPHSPATRTRTSSTRRTRRRRPRRRCG